jgi:hypothetical protein
MPPPLGQATSIVQQLDGLALAIGVGKDLPSARVGKAFASTIQVANAQYFLSDLRLRVAVWLRHRPQPPSDGIRHR